MTGWCHHHLTTFFSPRPLKRKWQVVLGSHYFRHVENPKIVCFSIFHSHFVLIQPNLSTSNFIENFRNIYIFFVLDVRAGMTSKTLLSWGKCAVLCVAMLCNVLSFRFDWSVCSRGPPPRPTGRINHNNNSRSMSRRLSGICLNIFPPWNYISFCHRFAKKDTLPLSPASPDVVQI